MWPVRCLPIPGSYSETPWPKWLTYLNLQKKQKPGFPIPFRELGCSGFIIQTSILHRIYGNHPSYALCPIPVLVLLTRDIECDLCLSEGSSRHRDWALEHWTLNYLTLDSGEMHIVACNKLVLLLPWPQAPTYHNFYVECLQEFLKGLSAPELRWNLFGCQFISGTELQCSRTAKRHWVLCKKLPP
jgi:hypothetical protein